MLLDLTDLKANLPSGAHQDDFESELKKAQPILQKHRGALQAVPHDYFLQERVENSIATLDMESSRYVYRHSLIQLSIFSLTKQTPIHGQTMESISCVSLLWQIPHQDILAHLQS